MIRTVDSYQELFRNLSKVLLVAVFLTFPVALALGNLLAVLFLITTVLAGDMRRRCRQVLVMPGAWPLLLLFLWVLAGAVYTTAPGDTAWLHVSKYAKLLACLVLASALLEQQARRHCLLAFMAAMLFILISVYCGIFVSLPWSVTQQTGWGVDHTVVGDYITQNVMMTFFVLACLALLLEYKAPAVRIGLGILALLGAISITHLSWGRTGFFLLTVCLVVAVIGTVRGRKKLRMMAVLIGLAALIGLSSPLLMKKVNLGLQEVQAHETNITSSIGHRLYNYKATISMIREAPIFGTGTGSYSTENCKLTQSDEDCARFGWHPHNQYLFFLVENGVLAAVLFVALLISLVAAARKRQAPDKFLLLGFAAALAADSLVNSPLFSARESHFFILIMALLMAGPVVSSLSSRHGLANS